MVFGLQVLLALIFFGEFVLKVHPRKPFGEVGHHLVVVLVDVLVLHLLGVHALLEVGIEALEIVDVIGPKGIEEAIGSYHTQWYKDVVVFFWDEGDGLTGE